MYIIKVFYITPVLANLSLQAMNFLVPKEKDHACSLGDLNLALETKSWLIEQLPRVERESLTPVSNTRHV